MAKILLTAEQKAKLSSLPLDGEYLDTSLMDLPNEKMDSIKSAIYDLGVFDLDLSEVELNETGATVSPFIEEITGILKPNESVTFDIKGENFQPNSVVTVEGITDIVVVKESHDLIKVTATCNDTGLHEVEIKNGSASSKDWGDHFVDCIAVPNGVETRYFATSVSAQFSNSYSVGNLNDANTGTQWFTPNGQSQDAFIQWDLGTNTFLTKLGRTGNAIYGSNNYTIQVSQNGTDWDNVNEFVYIPDNTTDANSAQNVEWLGAIGKFIRVVWSNPRSSSYANANTFYLYGKQ